MSWEFRRNLWIQLTPHRLIATSIVLGVVFLTADRIGALRWVSAGVFFLFAGFWGTRRAADSIMEEVIGGTWQNQRMSAVGAWPMAWGKLFGATAFAWYGAGIAWIVRAYADFSDAPLRVRFDAVEHIDLIAMLVFAVLAQAMSLLVALIQMRRRRRGRHMTVGIGQIAGLMVLIPFLDRWSSERVMEWYGNAIPAWSFLNLSALAFLFWAMVAIHQLMRAELQYRDMTLRVPAFAVFLMTYLSGFVDIGLAPEIYRAVVLQVAGTAALLLYYAALLAAPGEPVALLRLMRALRAGDWKLIGELAPSWLPAGLIFAAVAIAVIVNALASPVTLPKLGFWWLRYAIDSYASWVAAILVFAARDAGIVLLFAIGKRPERADVNSIVSLAVLHGLLPWTWLAFQSPSLAGLTSPVPGASTALMLVAALAQLLLLGVLLNRRLAQLQPKGVAYA